MHPCLQATFARCCMATCFKASLRVVDCGIRPIESMRCSVSRILLLSKSIKISFSIFFKYTILPTKLQKINDKNKCFCHILSFFCIFHRHGSFPQTKPTTNPAYSYAITCSFFEPPLTFLFSWLGPFFNTPHIITPWPIPFLNFSSLLFPFFLLLYPQLPDDKTAQRTIILVRRHIRNV